MLVKVTLSEYMQNLLAEAGRLTHTSQKGALERLLVQVELYARNGKLDLGLEWTEAMLKLSGRISSVPGAAVREMQETIDFDVSLLETSAKCKGGFAGVYLVNGSKFRAIVPNPKGGTCFLGSRPQALDAAIDRYRWFEEYGLPYGNIGRYVDDLARKHPDWAMERCLEHARVFAKDTILAHMKWPFTADQATETLAKLRRARGAPADSQPQIVDSDEDQDPAVQARAAEALRKSAELFGDDDPDDVS